MKIGIDVRAAMDEPAGIGKLVANLVRELAAIKDQDELIFYSARPATGLPSQNKNVVLPSGRGSLSMLFWHLRAVLHAVYVARVDRFIAVATLQAAVLAGRRVVLVIPDITNVLFPEMHGGRAQYLGRLLMRPALRRAGRIITISEHTRKDVLAFAGGTLPPERVSAALISCEPEFYEKVSADKLDAVRAHHKLPRRYVLFVGTLEPRKNVPLLVRAFSSVAQEIPDVSLVIAGRKGWKWEDIFAAAKSSPVTERIMFRDYVRPEDLPALYQSAELFVYPSLYEGFGIPPLEAMACGAPVITSNVSSLPEVTGDAALLVDPRNEHALRDKMLQVLNDVNLQKTLKEKGKVQAGKFSWRSFARRVLDIIHEAP